MNKNSYVPQPIVTGKSALPQEFDALVEILAANTHECWSQLRMEEGWTYGPRRDDALKQTPCLVPYEILPEDEKKYDRQIVQQVLQAAIKLGYTVSPPESHQKDSHQELELAAEKLWQQVGDLSTQEMFEQWKKRDQEVWKKKIDLYALAGASVLKDGEPLLAYDILAEGLAQLPDLPILAMYPDDQRRLYVRMSQQQALALAQSGAVFEARNLLVALRAKGAEDGETAGLLGRTFKTLAFSLDNDEQRKAACHEAFSVYLQGYRKSKDQGDLEAAYYNGVNAATMALFSGLKEQAENLAGEVEVICRELIDRRAGLDEKNDCWLDATLGELALLRVDLEQAEAWYRQAVSGKETKLREKTSMYTQACYIARYHGIGIETMRPWFSMPAVAALTGMSSESCSKEKEEFLREKIGQWIDRHHIAIAYGCPLPGPGMLFLEEIVKRQGEITLFLPFAELDFIERYFPDDPSLQKRFLSLKKSAMDMKPLNVFCRRTIENSICFTHLCIAGAALNRSKQLQTEFHHLALQDSVAGALPLPLLHHDHEFTLLEHLSCQKYNEEDFPGCEMLSGTQPIRHYPFLPVLFADVRGYSKLDETDMTLFATFFMAEAASVIERFEKSILSRRTVGDGIFLVFTSLQEAVELAVSLQEMVNQTEWSKVGLPADLRMRLSLDAGPCYSYIDPVVGRIEFCGNYIVRAARLEPITPPGHIFATETFVHLAHALAVSGVSFTYAGQVALPKNYGCIPAYHVRKTMV